MLQVMVPSNPSNLQRLLANMDDADLSLNMILIVIFMETKTNSCTTKMDFQISDILI